MGSRDQGVKVMFNLKYPDGALFKKLFYGGLKALSEVPLQVNQTALTLRALSPDKNILIEIYVPSTAFETYDVGGDTLVTGDRDEFLKAVRRSTKKDIVNLRYEDGAEFINLSLINTKTGAERTYRIRVIEYGKELIQSLELELPVKIQIASDDLKKLISDAKLIGDELELLYNEGNLEASSKAEGKEFKEILALDKPLLSIDSKDPSVTSKYDIDLLKNISPSLDVADSATLEFGSGLPLKITLNSDDGSHIIIWIAPRT